MQVRVRIAPASTQRPRCTRDRIRRDPFMLDCQVEYGVEKRDDVPDGLRRESSTEHRSRQSLDVLSAHAVDATRTDRR
jgi:hypothetical protein